MFYFIKHTQGQRIYGLRAINGTRQNNFDTGLTRIEVLKQNRNKLKKLGECKQTGHFYFYF